MTLGNTIGIYRRKLGLTQEGLAQKLNVTNQAVSKWETDQSCPDTMMLPKLADVLEVSLDTLFGRETAREEAEPEKIVEKVAQLPWEDDDALRIVVYCGHSLIDNQELEENCVVTYEGPVRDLHCQLCVECGDVSGNVNAGSYVECGDVDGAVNAGSYVECGSVGGDVKSGGYVECGDVQGHVETTYYVECGDVSGNLSAGSYVECGDVAGSVQGGAYVECGDVGGNVQSGGYVECGGVGGAVHATGDVEHKKFNPLKGFKIKFGE